jgi:hypothetical protein
MSKRRRRKKNKELERESHDSGIVSPEKNALMEQHFREHPEGDPAVRRKNPVRGTIVVEEETGYAGIMRVSKPRVSKLARRPARKRRAA